MKTVKQVSQLTGVSVRALRHYDAIGLLRPSAVTEAGYRLYDEDALEQLYLILVYRELGFPLKEIRAIMEAPDYDRNRVLEHQIGLLEKQKRKLENRILLASCLQRTGVKYMDFKGLNLDNFEETAQQVKTLWGKSEAYQEYAQKSQGRSREAEQALGDDLMALFVKAGTIRDAKPDSPEAQAWVKELQDFITAHFYTCTKPILKTLGQMYTGGGSFTENIDTVGGKGTADFAQQAIDIYCAE